MALKIISADEGLDIGALTTVIYGPPGIGKTTLGFMCRKPLLLDFEGGSRRAAKRGDIVDVKHWDEVRNISIGDLKDASGEQYKTVVVDTVGRALDHLSRVVVADNPKNEKQSGGLTLSGYGDLGDAFTAWLRSLTNLGLDVVLIAHGEERQRDDGILERIDVPGEVSRKEIQKEADIMGKMHMVDGKRTITFTPSEAQHGKDPGGLGAVSVPLPTDNALFLSELIEQTRKVMEERVGSSGVVGAPMLADLQEAVSSNPGTKFTDHFTEDQVAASLTREARVMRQRRASAAEAQSLSRMASEYGFEWDKDARQYNKAVNGAAEASTEEEEDVEVGEEEPATA